MYKLINMISFALVAMPVLPAVKGICKPKQKI